MCIPIRKWTGPAGVSSLNGSAKVYVYSWMNRSCKCLCSRVAASRFIPICKWDVPARIFVREWQWQDPFPFANERASKCPRSRMAALWFIRICKCTRPSSLSIREWLRQGAFLFANEQDHWVYIFANGGAKDHLYSWMNRSCKFLCSRVAASRFIPIRKWNVPEWIFVREWLCKGPQFCWWDIRNW